MKNEEYKDRGLRQALQRRNEDAERRTLSEDFTDRLMERLEKPTPNQREGRIHFYWVRLVGAAAAACILLLLLLNMNPHVKGDDKIASSEKVRSSRKKIPLKTEKVSAHNGKTVAIPAKNSQEPSVVAEVRKEKQTDRALVEQHAVKHRMVRTASTTDSLDYYIAKIERELTQVDESLYIERMQKLIRADERLQRIVNNYLFHQLDKDGRPMEAVNTNNVNTNDNEE